MIEVEDLVELRDSTVEELVQQQVQRQLTEQGEYCPLQLLISTGRLLTVDYEEWRRGKHKTLDGLLINKRVVKSLLTQAEAYAVRIGLLRKDRDWLPWIESAGGSLKPSRYTDINNLLCCRYLPQRNDFQADLFYDNADTTTDQGVVAALIEGSLERVEQSLLTLYRIDPCHPDLGLYEHLKRYLRHCFNTPCKPETLAKEFRVLSEKIVPIANAALKGRADEFTRTYWKRLISCCESVAYQNRPEPNLLSCLHWEIGDWQGVVDASAQELAGSIDVNVLLRRAFAFSRLHLTVKSYQVWFLMAGLNLENFSSLIQEQPDHSLQSLWGEFEDSDQLSLEAFPAFCLLVKPSLIRGSGTAFYEGLDPNFASINEESYSRLLFSQKLYRIVDGLIEVDQMSATELAQDHAERSIELRKQLSELSPILMKIYLETRSFIS